MTPTPEELFLSNLSTIDGLVQIVCRRHRLSRADGEEFASIVRLRLIEQDYAVIRKFRGGSSLRTYLAVVIARLCLDYRAACWGRWRPSQGARRLGPAAVRLEKLMVRDGLSFDEAFATLPASDRTLGTERLRGFAARFPVRTKRRWVEIENLEDGAAARTDPQIGALLHDDRRVGAALGGALKSLDPADRRLLKLRFSNGMSISSIAKREGLDQASLYRRVAGLLKKMRRELESRGIEAAAH